uniref:Uncharacterized protein n=1 Tax=Anguilla anguilla TaxID=7936 RepID=A0A0E9XC09_ANGAN
MGLAPGCSACSGS